MKTTAPAKQLPRFGAQFSFREPGNSVDQKATVVTARLNRGDEFERAKSDAVLLAIAPGEVGDDVYAVIYANAEADGWVRAQFVQWHYTLEEALDYFKDAEA